MFLHDWFIRKSVNFLNQVSCVAIVIYSVELLFNVLCVVSCQLAWASEQEGDAFGLLTYHICRAVALLRFSINFSLDTFTSCTLSYWYRSGQGPLSTVQLSSAAETAP